jgi:hypothetical protein
MSKPYSISRANLEKLPRSEQRRLLELGYVVDDKAEPKK